MTDTVDPIGIVGAGRGDCRSKSGTNGVGSSVHRRTYNSCKD